MKKVLNSIAKSLSDVCGGIGVSSFLCSSRFIILNKDLGLFAFFFTRSELYFILNAFSRALTLFFCLLNASSSTSSRVFLHLLSSLRLFCFSSLMSSDVHRVGFLRVTCRSSSSACLSSILLSSYCNDQLKLLVSQFNKNNFLLIHKL